MIFRRTTAQTAGRVLEYTIDYRPCEAHLEEHVHPEQEHQVEILEGSLEISLCGRTQHLEPGEVLLVPAGQAHVVWNGTGAPARAMWHTFPAGQTEVQLESEWLRERVR